MIKIIVYLSALLAAVLVGCTSKTTDKNNNANNDSIQKYIALAGNDTLDHAIRIQYNDKALSFLDVKKNDSLTKEYLNSLVFNYLGTKEWKKYHRFAKIYFQKSNEAQDTLGLARCYRYKAGFYKNTKVFDSSFYYYLKAEKAYLILKDKVNYANILFNKGFVQYSVNDFLAADLSLTKAYSIIKNTNDNVKKYAILNQLGLVSNGLGEYDKAINYFSQALTIAKENNHLDNYRESICLSNIGLAYQNLEDDKKAITFFNKSLIDNKLKRDFPELYSNIIDNLAYSKLQINDLNGLPILFFESLDIRKTLNDKSAVIISYIHLSEYCDKIKQKNKALKYANLALGIAKSNKIPIDLLFSLKQASLVDKKNAAKYSDDYLRISDRLHLEERKSKDRFTRIALETDEISQEKETAIQQKWIITGIALAVLIILFLLFIIFLQRSRQKELQFLRSQEKANEEIYQLMLAQKSKEEAAKQAEKKRISLELHDGIMNKLASTRLNLAVLSHNREDATITKCLTHITDIYQIEQEIRTIAHDLNKEVFQKSNSYTELLQDFVSDQNKNATTHYELEVEEAIDWTAISSELKMNLYRIIQEACHNINKHAAAKKAIISIILDLPNICLSVCDDGIGFDTSKKADGIGIQNIQQRVKLLNGKFSMYSTPHTATSINVAIPI
jgi:signal transduction histidine kinase